MQPSRFYGVRCRPNRPRHTFQIKRYASPVKIKPLGLRVMHNIYFLLYYYLNRKAEYRISCQNFSHSSQQTCDEFLRVIRMLRCTRKTNWSHQRRRKRTAILDIRTKLPTHTLQRPFQFVIL